MAEKTISKAEQNRLDRENKKAFITDAFSAVMNAIAKHSLGVVGGPKIQISFSNGNRYIRWNAYSMSVAILIYRDGNIEIKLSDITHSPHTEQLFVFSLDRDLQKQFLKKFKKMLSWLMPEILGNDAVSFHAFMDFLGDNLTLEDSHENMLKERRKSECRKK